MYNREFVFSNKRLKLKLKFLNPKIEFLDFKSRGLGADWAVDEFPAASVGVYPIPVGDFFAMTVTGRETTCSLKVHYVFVRY